MTDKPICLVTGASRGLGAALAVGFAEAGYHVVAVARTKPALEQLDDRIMAVNGGQPATLVPMDIRDSEAVDRLGAALYARFGKLDVLVLNAAVIGSVSPVAQSEVKYFEDAWRTNCLAPYRLIRSLDPLLRAAPAGRVIGVTCAAAIEGGAFWGLYGASKAGFEAMLRSYAAEITGGRPHINLVDPGPMATKLRKIAFPGEEPGTQPEPEALVPAFIELARAEDTRHGERIVLPR